MSYALRIIIPCIVIPPSFLCTGIAARCYPCPFTTAIFFSVISISCLYFALGFPQKHSSKCTPDPRKLERERSLKDRREHNTTIREVRPFDHVRIKVRHSRFRVPYSVEIMPPISERYTVKQVVDLCGVGKKQIIEWACAEKIPDRIFSPPFIHDFFTRKWYPNDRFSNRDHFCGHLRCLLTHRYNGAINVCSTSYFSREDIDRWITGDCFRELKELYDISHGKYDPPRKAGFWGLLSSLLK